MKRLLSVKVITSELCFIMAFIAFIGMQGKTLDEYIVPLTCLLVFVVVGCLSLLDEWKNGSEAISFFSSREIIGITLFSLLCVSIYLFGFYLSIFWYIPILYLNIESKVDLKNILAAVALTIVTTIAVYVIFEIFLGYLLPEGLLYTFYF